MNFLFSLLAFPVLVIYLIIQDPLRSLRDEKTTFIAPEPQEVCAYRNISGEYLTVSSFEDMLDETKFKQECKPNPQYDPNEKWETVHSWKYRWESDDNWKEIK